MAIDTWQQKSDEELLAASEHLSEYTEEAEKIIRAELQGRRLPEPQPTIRTLADEQSKQPNWFGLVLIVVLVAAGIVAGILFYSSQSKTDANQINEMTKPLLEAAEKEGNKGNAARAEWFLHMVDGLILEKRLILASSDERSPRDLDAISKLVTQTPYNRILKDNLSASQYEQLQRLREEHKYIKY